MVRLKDNVFDCANDAGIFQFHYGTIKSMRNGITNASFAYFNSTMVRLKEIWIITDYLID